MKKITITFVAALLTFPLISACQNSAIEASSGNEPDFLAVDKGAMQRAKLAYQKGDEALVFAVDALRRQADKALLKGPYSVMTKSLTADSGDKHDYISIGPYWWPDPSKPDGLPWIRRDGQRNPATSGPDTDKLGFNGMFYGVSSLALAHYFSGEEKYAAHANALIHTWFVNPETRMNPNLNFGQAVPGQVSGREFGIIESRFLIRLLDDISILQLTGALPSDTYNGFKDWLGQYLDWLLNSKFGQLACAAHNNHGTYCEAQVAAYAWYLGKVDLAKTYVERAKSKRLGEQVTATGAQPDELERTRPWHYSLFNLEAYFFLAQVGEKVGVDLWHHEAENGASVRKALDYVVAVVDTGKADWHGYKVKSSVRTGRLFYFLQQASKVYDESYLDKTAALLELIANEDRSELTLCLLTGPSATDLTIDALRKVDPTGKKSEHRCYY